MKGPKFKGSGNIILRNSLVTIQFAISLILIIGVIICYKQLNFMKNKDLGFSMKQKFVIEFPADAVNSENYKNIKEEFKKIHSVVGTTVSSSVPGRWRYYWNLSRYGESEGRSMVHCFQADYDYIPEFELELIAGKPFDNNLNDSSNMGYIFNESAIKQFGWATPEEAFNNKDGWKIRGVFKDYHFKSLKNKIEPMGLFLIGDDHRYITLRLSTENIQETLNSIEDKYYEIFPETVYNFFFMDEDFNKLYFAEERTSKILGILTILGILIACIGLFGLASFISEQKTKEIGIRKVNGANVSNIVILLSKNFTKWVLIAFIIASPISFLGMNKWLQSFAYKIQISWWIFILAGILALIIALTTVSYQTIKAARRNPVDSLKYE